MWVRAVVLMTMVVSSISPSAYALYRCWMSDTVHASEPPCHDVARPSESDLPEVKARECCSREVVSVERAPSPPAPVSHDSVMAPPPIALPNLQPLVAALDAPRPAVAEWPPFDNGPPILRRVCSLQI
jgi:hypothetical protein